jgi:NAD(P)-dependent dehydrogenase (short-subunit alcohol dehydrogenase family)
MTQFAHRLAVLTGAGSGIGRATAVRLAGAGCNLALGDMDAAALDDVAGICRSHGVVVSTKHLDVTDRTAVALWPIEVGRVHGTNHVEFLFNIAGLSGGGSFVNDPIEEWDYTFDVCWGGVYRCCRAFLPMLLRSESAHIVNVSSVNGFWASLGPTVSHTAYSAAKFAVKGFSEALVTDLRLNAPHVRVSVVMPGHIGTAIALNSARAQGFNLDDPKNAELRALGEAFRDTAPTSPDQCAEVILDGVSDDRWRILVGTDAQRLDELVRSDPYGAYEPSFVARLQDNGLFEGIVTDQQ